MVTGISRLLLGYRLGPVINLLAVLWAAVSIESFLRDYITQKIGNYPFDIGSAMCCDLLAAIPGSVAAGAPVKEIEITPEMITAGAEVIWGYFYDVMVYGDESGRELALKVFQAMICHLSSN